MPYDFRVAELGAADGDDGVTGVLGESVTAIHRVGNLLCLFFHGIQCVDGHDTVRLAGEETRGIVDVYDAAARKDAFTFGTRVYRNRLVDPSVKIFRGRVTPMLVTGDDVGRVI